MAKRFLLIALLCLLFSSVTLAQPVPTHPRLWLTEASLARHRTWARDDNPIYAESLLPMAEQAKQDMDAGSIQNGDLGGNAYEDYVTENYAALFAFMSLIHPDEAQRVDYAQRARTLLLAVMTQAAQGSAPGEPFRDPAFSINDRSRWYGVSFPLTVDWIYPTLSAEDKALIRGVFLRWMEELTYAATTNLNHPEPVGVFNDPILISDIDAVRWSGNNYYTAHMRNMGMMALAFDPADDPDGALTSYLTQATGAWLYVNDHLLRTEAAGGFGTEGFEYSPQSLGYTAQFLLALHTAGMDDPALYGQQVSFTTNTFWDDSVKAYYHSLSPDTVLNPDYNLPVYEPAWYGSGQNYQTPDFIELFAPLGIYDDLTANGARLNEVRWAEKHTLMGGADALVDRSNDASEFHKAILYFMLFDPDAPEPTDPRPNFAPLWYASGMRRLLARTDWSADATWFTYSLSWNRVDHQAANGNAIEFYRAGEWLTKVRVGYDLDYIASDNMNTLTVQNDPIDRDDFRLMLWERGSQWLYSANNPPPPVFSSADDYLYVTGDSTALYNTDYEGLNGVAHVSRSVLWLKPDILVIYDRAVTQAEDRPKRFILNFPATATVNGNLINMTTASGQHLYITSLLPANAAISVNPLQDEISSPPAFFETMRFRLEINAGGASDVRFLNVLQGANDEVEALPATLITCTDGTVADGAAFGGSVVIFAHDANASITTLGCILPAGTVEVYLTNLTPNGTYDVTLTSASEGVTLSATDGATYTADSVGVLHVTVP